MRRLLLNLSLIWLGIVSPVTHAQAQLKSQTVYQAFQMPYREILSRLPFLARMGFDVVEISPPQKSIPRPEWWAVYQPVDYREIDPRFGTEQELTQLTQAAASMGISIIADVVLNHMASVSGFPSLDYPQFSFLDFHFPNQRPCIRDWQNRFEVTHYWLCFDGGGGLPDLDTSSPHVFQTQLQFLKKLVNLGIRGFRFDAAKHIEPEYYANLISSLPPLELTYGEVVSGSDESSLYTPIIQVTDFAFLGSMLGSFSSWGDLRSEPQGLPSDRAVRFSRNHDTVYGDHFFEFESHALAMLAGAYVLSRGDSVGYIFRDDAEDPTIQAALQFRAKMNGRDWATLPNWEICDQCNSPNLVVIRRGQDGFAMIHKGTSWLEAPSAMLAGLEPGEYQEDRYGFTITLIREGEKLRIARWGKVPGGFSIGPDTALFLHRL